MVKIEICVDSMVSVSEAEKGGAHRIELCSNISIGGTTPSRKFMEQARNNFTRDIHAMIRPRFGDFCYDDYEIEEMIDNIKIARSTGMDGVVLGVLNSDGTINIDVMKYLLTEVRHMKVTFHRAFDMTVNLFDSLEVCKSLGINYVLTSGGMKTALDAVDLLAKLVGQTEDSIQIMPGAGIRYDNIETILNKTKAQNIHLSSKKIYDSPMLYRNTHISMGLGDLSEYTKIYSDANEIKKIVSLVNKSGSL